MYVHTYVCICTTLTSACNFIETPVEQLAVAPAPEPRELTETEQEKVRKQREAILRELRVFLRDLTNKLLAERKFKEFTKPVDPEEVRKYSIKRFLL